MGNINHQNSDRWAIGFCHFLFIILHMHHYLVAIYSFHLFLNLFLFFFHVGLTVLMCHHKKNLLLVLCFFLFLFAVPPILWCVWEVKNCLWNRSEGYILSPSPGEERGRDFLPNRCVIFVCINYFIWLVVSSITFNFSMLFSSVCFGILYPFPIFWNKHSYLFFCINLGCILVSFLLLFFFLNWDSPHARLKSH